MSSNANQHKPTKRRGIRNALNAREFAAEASAYRRNGRSARRAEVW
ncbi:hypothetical protein JRC04_04975 [Mycolicibacterium sp. S2-37]|nr:hypothetical protein [Mycolicibacterium sp. S2-37]MBO0676810.1 hypothetical protein [Mycolicibacterium sp. S2-37]